VPVPLLGLLLVCVSNDVQGMGPVGRAGPDGGSGVHVCVGVGVWLRVIHMHSHQAVFLVNCLDTACELPAQHKFSALSTHHHFPNPVESNVTVSNHPVPKRTPSHCSAHAAGRIIAACCSLPPHSYS
jgi:hypothetical protein